MAKFKTAFPGFVMTAALLLNACGQGQTGIITASAAPVTESMEPMQIISAEMFSDRDLHWEYENRGNLIPITLHNDSAECADESVSISGGTVTVTEAGVYILSGTLDNGSIIVDAQNTDKVQLVLNGAEISSENYAAIYVKQADKVFVTTADGSENCLSNGGSFSKRDDSKVDGAVFAKDDITFNGSGSLSISSPAGHGIVCNDELTVSGGSYTVNVGGQGLKAKDGILICASRLDIKAGKDGIHAEANDADKGLVYIDSGVFNIEADSDGISASSTVTVSSGSLNISCSDPSKSGKGIKAVEKIVLSGGALNVVSVDDCIHSNSDIEISGGSVSLCSEDDGIHADNAVTISDGNLYVNECYEGVEGKTIEILGGEIKIRSSDDGLNAAGGYDGSGFMGPRGADQFAETEDECHINISGGNVYLNADGDGIDSNGSLNISGGSIFISGPTDRNNCAIDYERTGIITGGTLVAAGSAQMAMNFGEQSAQCSMLINTGTQRGGSVVALKDKDANVIVDYIPEKDYSCVLISAPELRTGESYILTAGEYEKELCPDALLYAEGMPGGAMMPGHGQAVPHGMPGDMDGGRREAPDGRPGEMPPGGFGERPPEKPDMK